MQELEDYARRLRGSRAVLFFWERHMDSGYESCCAYAAYLAWAGGGRLPSSLHSRMVFGPANAHVKEYVKHYGV